MGDSGEGLIDAEGRIQEQIEERQREREQSKKAPVANPENVRKIESMTLARKELERQLRIAQHAGRRAQIEKALEDIDRRVAELTEGRGIDRWVAEMM